ncbi:uncharacterized protein LOC105858629 [Microcebus murinus]|uniref:uncharacterized protein LOC105858629 n=1 Tax=Microcebus murinus TaxID=30608 RepID=UPI003F6D1DAE
MGHSLSKEAVFIKELKASLRERGIRVKKKDLVKFFVFIDRACPWFIVGGPEIHPRKWQKVGRDLNNLLLNQGPDAVPVSVFSYWGLIRDIVEGADSDPNKKQLLSVAEFCLRPVSRSASGTSLKTAEGSTSPNDPEGPTCPSPCPSVCINMPPQDPSAELQTSRDEPPISRPDPKTLYPPLPEGTAPHAFNYPVFKRQSLRESLDPTEEATLEEEAARYHNPEWPPLTAAPHRPLPCPPQICAPSLMPPLTMPLLLRAKEDLSQRVTQLKDVLQLQKEFVQLSKDLSSLQDTLKDSVLISQPRHETAQSHVTLHKKSLKSSPKALALPVVTRSNRREDLAAPSSSQSSPQDSDNEDTEGRERESESDDLPEETDSEPTEFRRLKFKTLKELNSAVRTYGPNAPFTYSLLEAASGGGYLLPGEWIKLVQAVLSRGQFLSWKADFIDRCQTTAAHNLKNPSSASWTLEKLSGQGRFAAEQRQRRLPIGLLSQTAAAAFGAWRALPSTGSVLTALTKITQGAQEGFSEFVGRLLESAERTLRQEDSDNKLIKQLAYENANSTCRAILRGKLKKKDLNDMIQMCNDVDPFTHRVSQAVQLAVRAAIQGTAAQRDCFKCGQPGHFARQCPLAASSATSNRNKPPGRPDQPSSLCPRCRRGKHWANQSRSKTNYLKNPLPPLSENGLRGQPRAPRPIQFQSRRTADKRALRL